MRHRLLTLLPAALGVFHCFLAAQTMSLATSKQLIQPVPGTPQRLNSLPMAVAWSPNHRYLAIVNAGFGTVESRYEQSIAVLDTETGKLEDFPDDRTGISAKQTLYNGVAFSADGTHLYASIDSLEQTDGNFIAVYRLAGNGLKPERTIPVPLQKLAPLRMQNQIGKRIEDGLALPAPAGLAVVKGSNGAEQILVADEFSDDVLLIDAVSGTVVKRFDLASHEIVPSEYPITIIVSRDNRRAFVALWNSSAIAELDLESGKVLQRLPLLPPDVATAPSSHPTAFAMSHSEKTLYVALANRDAIAAVHLSGAHMQLAGMFNAQLPGQHFFGAMPDALALSADDATLYAANSGSDAVAVFSTQQLKAGKAIEASGFIPTEWYPTALALREHHLYIATGKGKGTGPNVKAQPQPANPSPSQSRRMHRPHTYIGTLLYGSLATVDLEQAKRDLPQLTKEVVVSNMMQAAEQRLKFQSGANPIHHVIYIIKENRTYDQIFGDLGVGNGDASLTMYGKNITPNLHKLALQFGLLDNFYDSGEVSGDGHVWSNAAITSDYTEKTWQQAYRGSARVYDFEGVVAQGYPIQEGISDINEPGSSYLWTDLARHGKTLYHFGEYVSTKFCDASGEAPKDKSPLAGTPEPPPERCKVGAINKGDAIPANYGGGISSYPWAIPLIFRNVATKPELEGHFDPLYPDFNLKFPDQLRVEEFLTHFRKWVTERQQGRDTMPQFVMLRLPNDHTAGTTPGSPTPQASVADNDLAVGRAVEAVSHSPYWDDTAFFVLEDDAQDGADHVDAHRSIALVISKYSPRAARPTVDSTFYTTVSFLRTMEDLLDVPPMTNNDAFAPSIASLFTGAGDQPSFDADYANRDNSLIYAANTPKAPGAKESSMMDFSHEDRADPLALNVILWRDAMGNKPVPWMLLHPHANHKGDDAGDGD